MHPFRRLQCLVSVVGGLWALGVLGAERPKGSWPAWFPQAPPLAKPAGQVVRVASVQGLYRAVERAKPGQTILVADGHYMMPRTLDLHADGLCLRGGSGDPRKVILDGAQSQHGELVAVTGCSGVTIADLTIQNVRHNGFKLNADRLAQRVTIYHCVIHNVWQRGVKSPFVPDDPQERFHPRGVRIQYCLFCNDRAKQFSDDPSDTPQTFGGNYVGGIDAMQCRAWVISDNVFVGIRGRTGEARGAIFLWQDSRDCLIERNVIFDCDSGICLGNSHRSRFPIHCTGCIVRNNFIVRAPENGILADYTRDCKIVHNTIHDPESRLKRLIRLVHDNEGLVVANNLLSGPPMRIETQSPVRFSGNLTRDMSRFFVDARQGNLHLKPLGPGASVAVERLPEVPEDFDRCARAAQTTVGADDPLAEP
ncbi:MAG: right-handed parallel beta-helix repeat-containing protein [Thermoguttaceae bacterium]